MDAAARTKLTNAPTESITVTETSPRNTEALTTYIPLNKTAAVRVSTYYEAAAGRHISTMDGLALPASDALPVYITQEYLAKLGDTTDEDTPETLRAAHLQAINKA